MKFKFTETGICGEVFQGECVFHDGSECLVYKRAKYGDPVRFVFGGRQEGDDRKSFAQIPDHKISQALQGAPRHQEIDVEI